MTHLVDAARETFWRDLVARFERRARPYCRRLRCSEDEIDEILWDLWQEATEHEQALAASIDQWPLLRCLLRQLCAARARSWRREFPLSEKHADVENTEPDGPVEAQDPGESIGRLLGDLPEKQRLAVDFRCRWGWPYWAVAAALDTSEPTARVHVARGLARLRHLVAALLPPPRIDELAWCNKTWSVLPSNGRASA